MTTNPRVAHLFRALCSLLSCCEFNGDFSLTSHSRYFEASNEFNRDGVFRASCSTEEKNVEAKNRRGGVELVTVKTTKFVVKVTRGTGVPEYVQRIDRTPIQTTTNRKLALVMGRFTAEDAVKSIHTSRCNPELVSVEVRT